MKVLIGGVEYEIVFSYTKSEYFSGHPMERETVVRRAVACKLIEQPDGKVTMHGAAECHPKDNFCKETGRKLALARAITVFNKAERAAIWAVYRTRGQNAATRNATAAGTPADVPPEGGFDCCGGDLIHGHEVGCIEYDGGDDPEDDAEFDNQ